MNLLVVLTADERMAVIIIKGSILLINSPLPRPPLPEGVVDA